MAQYNKSKDFDPFDIADLQFSETSWKNVANRQYTLLWNQTMLFNFWLL